MKLRLAKACDAAALAEVHFSCGAELRNSFTCRLGRLWLRAYYDVLLSDPESVVICAEDQDGRIVGFHSGSLDCAKQQARLRAHRIKLVAYAIPALLRRPALLLGMYRRYRAGSGRDRDVAFIVSHGARAECLGVIKAARTASLAIDLITNWFRTMEALQAGPIQFEVEASNEKVNRLHQLLGAKLVRTFVTAEGSERRIMCYPNNSVNS